MTGSYKCTSAARGGRIKKNIVFIIVAVMNGCVSTVLNHPKTICTINQVAKVFL